MNLSFEPTGELPRQRLRVALVASSYNYIKDGVALTLNRLVAYLMREGVDVLVFAPVGKVAAIAHSGTVVPVPSVPVPARPEYRLALGLGRRATETLRQFQPDIVHIALAPDPLGYAALKLARRLNVPVVASYHTRFETYLKHYWYAAGMTGVLRSYLRSVYGACREVYTPSQSTTDALLADGFRNNFRLWPRGVDTEQFNPAKRSSDWRAQHGIGEDEFVITFVSRLVREKQLATLAAVLQALEARGIAHRSLIVGDGPERAALERALPRSVFAGFLEGDDLAQAYASSDAFVFPSETETFGNVTLEAMASGLPCVCADATGSRSLVVHGRTGYLCEPRNSHDFAKRIAVLARDSDLREQMGAAARARSLEFSWDDAMARILGYYRSLLAETPGMKIVDISEFYSPTGGGVRNYVDHKFKAAAKHGHFLTVIAPGTEDRVELREGGKIIWVKTPQLPFDRNYRMFWGAEDVLRIVDAEAPDVVEGSSPWRGGWIAARWQGPAAKMLFMHQDPIAVYPQTLLTGLMSPAAIDKLFGWYWWYLRRLNRSFDGSVVAGTWLAERFKAHGLRNLHVVPFGVETKWFGPGLRDTALRTEMLAKCGLGPDAALLINVGRHHPEKRVGTAIDAVTKAQQSRPVGLYVIGDGFIHASIEAKAARAKNVHVAGWVKDRATLARMIASADAVLHCSSAETFGFSVAEALCCGTPVIVPDVGGAADLSAPEYAQTYPPGDADAAAKAILELLKRDRASLSAAATDAGRRIGDIETHFEKLFALYAQAIQSKPRHPSADANRMTVNNANA